MNQRFQNQKRQRVERPEQKKDEFESHTLVTRRVTKVVKGGKNMSFSALVVVGDKLGRVGLALAKGADPRSAIEKATTKAKKNVKKISLNKNTIHFELTENFKSSKIFLKPALQGTGLVCSTAVRPIVELLGIKDIYIKLYGTNNKITNAYCIMRALERMNK